MDNELIKNGPNYIYTYYLLMKTCLDPPGKPDLNTTLSIRQTISIFKQPVTKVTTHPSNKVKSDPQRMNEQPRQVRI